MLSVLQALPAVEYGPFTYVVADTDTTSEGRAKSGGVVPAKAGFLRIPRSREVGQSYAVALLMTLRAFLVSLNLVYALQPRLLLVNGPGTCLPVCLAAALLRALRCAPTRVVFIESVCRVHSLSLTGKLVYHLRIADQVQVQWPELAGRFPRATHVGVVL